MKTLPILFHDIDGVLFGDYAGEFQLRPGVKTWLAWAHEHFELVWLTSWESEKIKTLLKVLYCERFREAAEAPAFHHANWTKLENKVVWVQQAVQKLNGREWFWIDDDIGKFEPEIEAAGIPFDRCIQANPEGQDELVAIQSALARRLKTCGESMDSPSQNRAA